MSRAEDWLVYLNDPDAFDRDHFAQSLLDKSPEYAVAPDELFAFSPYRDSIVARLNDLIVHTNFNGLYYLPRDDLKLSPEKATNTLKDIVRVTAEYARIKGSLADAQSLQGANFVILRDIDEFQNFNTNLERDRTECFDLLGDAFRLHGYNNWKVFFAVKEAVLSLTNMPMVTNHILNAGLKFQFDFQPFFDFYIGGCQFFDFTDEIYVYVPK